LELLVKLLLLLLVLLLQLLLLLLVLLLQLMLLPRVLLQHPLQVTVSVRCAASLYLQQRLWRGRRNE